MNNANWWLALWLLASAPALLYAQESGNISEAEFDGDELFDDELFDAEFAAAASKKPDTTLNALVVTGKS